MKFGIQIQNAVNTSLDGWFPEPNSGFNLNALPNFKKAINYFDDGSVKIDVPSEDKIMASINLLLSVKPQLTKRDWRNVFWGLNADIKGKPLFEHEKYFEQILDNLNSLIQSSAFTKRTWHALAFSYFSMPEHDLQRSVVSKSLRVILQKGFNQIKAKESRPKNWSVVIKENEALFSEDPFSHASSIIISSQDTLNQVKQYIPFKETSWLWRPAFANLAHELEAFSNADFLTKIPELLLLLETFPRQANEVLSACLKRYYLTDAKSESHPLLKTKVLDLWGSPQIQSNHNRWFNYVDDRHLQMVAGWFAKDDLEYFFRLLQGNQYVDQSRLDFWLQYVDQISYTRIVMGPDVLSSNQLEFREYRRLNHRRYSSLLGSLPSNNAFILKIGVYWFVEFSETGNACYVYRDGDDSLPFSPEDSRLDLKLELKRQDYCLTRILHVGNTWQQRAEEKLIQYGIYKSLQKHHNSNDFANDLIQFALKAKLNWADNRAKKGAFWIYTPERIQVLDSLQDRGLHYAETKGYWFK
jgi:hypothetical protein